MLMKRLYRYAFLVEFIYCFNILKLNAFWIYLESSLFIAIIYFSELSKSDFIQDSSYYYFYLFPLPIIIY